MHAISLFQPYASCAVAGIKLHETRHWPLPRKVHGRIAIHAAQRFAKDLPADAIKACLAAFGPNWREELPRGALVGEVTLGRCLSADRALRDRLSPQEIALGKFEDGYYAWELKLPQMWEPVPYKGRQGFFLIPHTVVVHSVNKDFIPYKAAA